VALESTPNRRHRRHLRRAGVAAVGALSLAVPLLIAVPAQAAPAVAARGAVVSAVTPTATEAAKPRTIVTTDPELDDLNSMLRMLLYSNEIDIEGLVYSASQHHYAGNGTTVSPFRWPNPTDVFHIDTAINAYEEAYPNLVVHDANFPTPEHLRSITKWGNVVNVGDMSTETEGSNWIVDVLLDDEPGQVFLEAWGGPNTIARALKTIQERYQNTPEWAAIQEKVSQKAVITSWGQQDTTFTTYIRPNWPHIQHREVATSIWGYSARGSALPEWQKYLSPEWTRANVSDVGPMGAEYRVWGDGKQMAAGFDNEDYFGLSGYTSAQLRAMGYGVWTAPQPKDAWISEGDSSNFALLIQNGLRNYEHPSYGGWGGRQALNPNDPYQWRNSGVRDNYNGAARNDWAAGRWFEDFQLDFAARLKWTVTPSFDDANHAPDTGVTEGLDLSVKAGQGVTLHATATDPDGDALTYKWYQYAEADTYTGTVGLTSADTAAPSLIVPANASVGSTIHLILEVKDNGTPAMKHYERVILTVAPVDVQVSTSFKTLAGNAYLNVAATNTEAVPVNITLATPLGSKTFTGVQPGKSVSVSFNAKSATVAAGQVAAAVTGTFGGVQLTGSKNVAYGAFGS
jgi:hypothetical protein